MNAYITVSCTRLKNTLIIMRKCIPNFKLVGQYCVLCSFLFDYATLLVQENFGFVTECVKQTRPFWVTTLGDHSHNEQLF